MKEQNFIKIQNLISTKARKKHFSFFLHVLLDI